MSEPNKNRESIRVGTIHYKMQPRKTLDEAIKFYNERKQYKDPSHIKMSTQI